MSLVGRQREVELLERERRSARSSFVVVYGRRRIGKTELLRWFAEKHRGLFFVGKKAPRGLELKELMTSAARVLREPLLAELAVDSWQRALELIVERHRGKEKLVLVLDEFQWSVAESPELPSVLQHLWDSSWSKSGKVMLVLCGSYLGFMEREVLGSTSPLFGRRSAQIHLQPFEFHEARAFHPRMSLEQQALTYFLTGGVAQYLKMFEPEASFRQNVERTVLSDYGPLADEPEFLLREELREVAPCYAALMAIAQGHRTPKAIATHGHLPERSLHYTLEALVSLGYVSRRFPLTGEKPKRTDVRFVLDDALLRFWFRFVYPNTSLVTQLGARAAFDQLVAPQLESWAGGAFERLCRQALPEVLSREGVAGGVEVGAWWDKGAEIDVVGIRGDAVTELGECKWGPVSGAQLGKDLERKRLAYPNSKNHTLRLHAFVRRVRGKVPEGVRVHTLESLVGPLAKPRWSR